MILIAVIFTAIAFTVLVFPKKYSSYIEKYSKVFSVETELVYAVARCESGFSSEKISSKGAVGIMQVMPNTAKWCCETLGIEYDYEKLKVPEYNLKIGIFYLSYLSAKFDKVDDVIKAYNAGETIVRKWNKEGLQPYSETRKYLKKVKFCMKIYKIV